jgi:hypothetical protein
MTSGPPLGATAYGNLPTSGHVFGAQAHGVGTTTAPPPGRPDFEPYFGKPMREIVTNPYEGCVRPPLIRFAGGALWRRAGGRFAGPAG